MAHGNIDGIAYLRVLERTGAQVEPGEACAGCAGPDATQGGGSSAQIRKNGKETPTSDHIAQPLAATPKEKPNVEKK